MCHLYISVVLCFFYSRLTLERTPSQHPLFLCCSFTRLRQTPIVRPPSPCSSKERSYDLSKDVRDAYENESEGTHNEEDSHVTRTLSWRWCVRRTAGCFFLSGFLTVCELTHPEKVSCDLIHRAQLVSVQNSFNRVVTTKDQQKHQHTSIWSHPFKHLTAFDILSTSYPRRWRIQAFPEIRHHFNVRRPGYRRETSRNPMTDSHGTILVYLPIHENSSKKNQPAHGSVNIPKKSHGMVWKFVDFPTWHLVGWQLIFFEFSPRTLGEMIQNDLVFLRWMVQPPNRNQDESARFF